MLICATSIFRSIWLFFNSYVEYLRSFIYLFILLFIYLFIYLFFIIIFFLVCVILVNFEVSLFTCERQ